MYAHQDIWIEDVCYDMDHIHTVLKIIRKNFEEYFDDFLSTGNGISAADFEQLKKSLGCNLLEKLALKIKLQSIKLLLLRVLTTLKKTDRSTWIS